MMSVMEQTGIRWKRMAGRGAAVLLLLASAACQQGGNAGGSEGGMFGGSAKSENKSGNSAQSAGTEAKNASAAAPAAVPAAAPVPGTAALAAPAAAPAVVPPSAVSTADGQDRRVRINNQSGQTVTLVKGSPVSQNNWGADRIPTTTLGNGQSVIVDFNDNNGECNYDLQVTLQDGTERYQRAVNICRITDWTITPGGTQAR